MTENYESPYGFGPAIDALLDVVADRQGITVDELADTIHGDCAPDHSEASDTFNWIDVHFWDQYVGPAVDALEDLIFPEVKS